MKTPNEINADVVKACENNCVPSAFANGTSDKLLGFENKEHVGNHVGNHNDSVNSQTVKILSDTSENKILVESSKGKYDRSWLMSKEFHVSLFNLDDPNRSHKKKKKDRDRDRDGKCFTTASLKKHQVFGFSGKKEKPAEVREKSKKSKKDKNRDRDREQKKPKESSEKRKEAIKEQQPLVSSTTQTITSPKQELHVSSSPPKLEIVSPSKEEVISSTKVEITTEILVPVIVSTVSPITEEIVTTLSENAILLEDQPVKADIVIAPVVKEEPLPVVKMEIKEEDEPSAKKIKIEVKKPEKTREDVTRILNFTSVIDDSIQPPPPCDLKSVESSTTSSTTNSTPSSSRKNSDDVKRNSDDSKRTSDEAEEVVVIFGKARRQSNQ